MTHRFPSRPTPAEPIVAIHERGVFRDAFTFGALVSFSVYNCRGALVERVSVRADWHPDDVEARLMAMLDQHCPVDEAHECPTPDDVSPRLRLA